ncbi:hypothetical protein [Bradyrhizobium sp. DASA03120]|uniref:hypothetical protein n=1 Tax=Bradyrhizobium sp. SMVTL-02 TaxID=3395917 RepID=UPI003F6FA7E8
MSEESLKGFCAFTTSLPQSRCSGREHVGDARVTRAARLLLGRHRLQALIEKCGAISRQHLLEIRLECAFALAQTGAARYPVPPRQR